MQEKLLRAIIANNEAIIRHEASSKLSGECSRCDLSVGFICEGCQIHSLCSDLERARLLLEKEQTNEPKYEVNLNPTVTFKSSDLVSDSQSSTNHSSESRLTEAHPNHVPGESVTDVGS